jgi:glyoxylase I family protein
MDTEIDPWVRKHLRRALLIALVLGGCMSHVTTKTTPTRSPSQDRNGAVVRYQIADVERAIRFYTEHLGFDLEQHSGPAFASVTRGPLRLLLSGPGSSGARPMPDGARQAPGGWNRIVLFVDDLAAEIESLKKAGTVFRNEIESGPGGTQIQIEDPDGNPIELHQPASK